MRVSAGGVKVSLTGTEINSHRDKATRFESACLEDFYIYIKKTLFVHDVCLLIGVSKPQFDKYGISKEWIYEFIVKGKNLGESFVLQQKTDRHT